MIEKLKRLSSKSSHHKENFFLYSCLVFFFFWSSLFCFYCIYMRRQMLADYLLDMLDIVVIISQYM